MKNKKQLQLKMKGKREEEIKYEPIKKWHKVIMIVPDEVLQVLNQNNFKIQR